MKSERMHQYIEMDGEHATGVVAPLTASPVTIRIAIGTPFEDVVKALESAMAWMTGSGYARCPNYAGIAMNTVEQLEERMDWNWANSPHKGEIQ